MRVRREILSYENEGRGREREEGRYEGMETWRGLFNCCKNKHVSHSSLTVMKTNTSLILLCEQLDRSSVFPLRREGCPETEPHAQSEPS